MPPGSKEPGSRKRFGGARHPGSMDAEFADPTADELLAGAGWLRALACRLARDEGEADDLLQDTWLAARSQAPGTVAGPWLVRVLRNAARQRGRSEARRAWREARAATPEPEPPEALRRRMELSRELVGLVLELREPYRSTVVQHYYDGRSTVEIARAQGLPEATVRTRLARARSLLRERLDARGGERAWRAVVADWPAARTAVTPWLETLSYAAGGWAMSTATKSLLVITCALAVAALGHRMLSPGERSVPGVAPSGAAAAPQRGLDDPRGPSPQDGRDLVASGSQAEGQAPADKTPESSPGNAALVVTADVRTRTMDPLGGVELRLNGGPGTAAVEVPGGGLRWDLEPPQGGTLDLVLAHPDHAPHRRTVEWTPGRSLELGQVVLGRGGTLAGRVLGNGRALADVEVWLGPSGGQEDPWARARRGPGFERAAGDVSAADGSFRMTAVPVGTYRLWAGAEGWLWTVADGVVVRAETPLEGLELSLEPLPDEDRVTGRVLDPEGRGVAGATVTFGTAGEERVHGSVISAEDGTFALVLHERRPHDLRASDAARRWPDLVSPDVAPGSRGVDLVFGAPPTLVVRVSSSRGQPAEGIELRTMDRHGARTLGVYRDGEQAPGRLRIQEPAEPFTLLVSGAGYGRAYLGPFAPGALGSPYDIELESVGGLTGRVVAAGRPVAGARLALHATAGDQAIHHRGFPTRLWPTPDARGTSADDGTFRLQAGRRGAFELWITHDDFAPEGRPVDLADAVDLGDVELTSGGRLVGTVSGAQAPGVQVALSGGNLQPRLTRVQRDGSFALERVTPGDAWLELLPPDFDPQGIWDLHAEGPQAQPHGVPCVIRPGATTRVDLDLERHGPAVLEVSWKLDGEPGAGWTAELQPRGGARGRPSDQADGTLDADGRVRLEVWRRGAYRLSLRPPGSPGLQLWRDLDLDTEGGAWSGDLVTGTLEVHGVERGEGVRDLAASGRCGDLEWRAPLRPDTEGRAVLAGAPAGPAAIRLRAGSPGAPLAQVVVPNGGTATVSVDRR